MPKICHIQPLYLAGLSFYGDPFELHAGWDSENEIGSLWKRFSAWLQAHPPAPPPEALYEVHLHTPESAEKGLFEVFVGMACPLEALPGIPPELLIKVLPATRYAVFTFQGAQISADWGKTIDDWLVESGERSPYSYNFQRYDERFKGMHDLEHSSLDVYVPLSAD
jgi:predicted transcriptional regulator YdeE